MFYLLFTSIFLTVEFPHILLIKHALSSLFKLVDKIQSNYSSYILCNFTSSQLKYPNY